MCDTERIRRALRGASLLAERATRGRTPVRCGRRPGARYSRHACSGSADLQGDGLRRVYGVVAGLALVAGSVCVAQTQGASGTDQAGSQKFSWPANQLLPSFPLAARTQDLITLSGGEKDEKALFSSLKGVVNREEPRIVSYEGDGGDEGPHAWLNSLGYHFKEVSDRWSLITKYRSDVQGIVVYDPALIDTLNLATTIAGPKHALVASPAQVARLTGEPYNLPVLVDLRGQYKNKLQVYQAIYDKYWPSLQHRILFSLNPEIAAAVREYATAVGGAAVWLDPKVSGEKALLDKFLQLDGAGQHRDGMVDE